MKLLKDDRGSILIFAAFVIMVMIIFSMFNVVMGFIFRDQVVIMDALDSSVTASLSPAEEVIRPTFYYEKFEITDWINVDGVDFPAEYKWVCRDKFGKDLSGYSANYIRLNEDDARDNAREYLERYLELNNVNATIDESKFKFNIKYDNDRWLPVIYARWNTGWEPHMIPNWWEEEFNDNGPFFTMPNQLIYVRFPKWVKTTVDTTITVPIPFGVGLAQILGGNSSEFRTITRRFVSSAVKEIKEQTPPPVFGWEPNP